MDEGFKEYCKRLFLLYMLTKTDHIIKEAKYRAMQERMNHTWWLRTMVVATSRTYKRDDATHCLQYLSALCNNYIIFEL